MTDSLVVADRTLGDAGRRFSLSLAVGGGIAATALGFILLMLGAGFGLFLARRGGPAPSAFLTGGAVYFIAAQTFAFAVGGSLVGWLLGPAVETRTEEDVRAASHGLAAWGVSVFLTIAVVSVAGLAAAGAGAGAGLLYGTSQPKAAAAGPTAYVVDRLFRPERGSDNAGAAPGQSNFSQQSSQDSSPQEAPRYGSAPPMQGSTGDSDAVQRARAEAGRLIEASMMRGGRLDGEDRSRLVMLVAEQAGISPGGAATRVDHTQDEISAKVKSGAESARKGASYASFWVALATLFGAFVSMGAAIAARVEDDRQG